MGNEAKAEAASLNETESVLKNLKEEMSRKVGNIETQFTTLKQTNEELLKQLRTIQPAAQPQPRTSLRERFYDDEEGTLRELKEEAKKEALQEFHKLDQKAAQRNIAVGQLMNDYPELADTNSELRKKAMELYGTLSKEEQDEPWAYKVAVRDAAAELGMLPKSKRQETKMKNDEELEDDESFTLTGSGSRDTKQTKKRGRDKELPEATKVFAELLGRPVDDEKYMERLKKAAERTVWNKFKKI